MRQYIQLIDNVLTKGVRRENRTGVDTISTFGEYYEIDLSEGFPLLTTKAMHWRSVLLEALWFLSGQRDISFLKKHGIKFWDAWVDADGKIPSPYGGFWRAFPVPIEGIEFQSPGGNEIDYIDQVGWVVDLLKREPLTRRAVVSAWEPGNVQRSKLPPCHVMWVMNAQPSGDICVEHSTPDYVGCKACMQTLSLNLHLTQRSGDVGLGVPFNIACYSFIVHLVAHIVGMRVGKFAHSIVDAHIYTSKPDGSMHEYDHVPALKEQMLRSPKRLPSLTIDSSIRSINDALSLMLLSDAEMLAAFRLDCYDPHPSLRMKPAV